MASEKTWDKVDAGIDLGVLVTTLLGFLGLGKSAWVQKLGSFFTGFGRTDAVKQRFGKWFGIGLDDEGELWKTTLALLRQREPHGMQKVIAIGQLQAAMKDDSERNMFRAILIKVSAGTTMSQQEAIGADGKKAQVTSTTSKLDTPDDLRVIALETLALLILGDKPEEAFKVTLDMGNGRHIVCPTHEEDIRIELALDIIRNQGLGKDSEPMRLARKAWNALTERFFVGLTAEVRSFIKERSTKTKQGYPDDYHPMIWFWVIERLLPGGYKTPLLNVWGVHFFAPFIRSKWEAVSRKWAAFQTTETRRM